MEKRSIEHQTFHCRTVTGVCQQKTTHTHLVIVKGTRTNRYPMWIQMHREALWVQVSSILIRGAKNAGPQTSRRLTAVVL